MKTSNVTVPVLIAAIVNVVHDLRYNNGGDATRIIFGNVALFAGLTAIGEFIDWDIAAMLAVLYLMHTMLTDGIKVIEWTTALTNNL
jgi:hypothetical protein